MSKFKNIARRSAVVQFRGHEIELAPLSLGFVMNLAHRFREFAQGFEDGDFVGGLMAAGDSAFVAIIAKASGVSEAEIEELAFSPDETINFIHAILEISFTTAEALGKAIAQAGEIVSKILSALGLQPSKG